MGKDRSFDLATSAGRGVYDFFNGTTTSEAADRVTTSRPNDNTLGESIYNLLSGAKSSPRLDITNPGFGDKLRAAVAQMSLGTAAAGGGHTPLTLGPKKKLLVVLMKKSPSEPSSASGPAAPYRMVFGSGPGGP